MNSVVRAIAVIGLTGSLGATLPADDRSEGRKIDLPVPIGHEVKGLRVPVRNEEGKIEMQFDMETATRLDEQNVEMHVVTIQTYNQQTGKPDAKIDLQTSMMNMDTNIIITKDPVRISREDFVLTGDGGEFNSKTRQGRVVGNVHLVIYNRNEFQTKPSNEGQQKEQ